MKNNRYKGPEKAFLELFLGNLCQKHRERLCERGHIASKNKNEIWKLSYSWFYIDLGTP